jgi:hypothetical protein
MSILDFSSRVAAFSRVAMRAQSCRRVTMFRGPGTGYSAKVKAGGRPYLIARIAFKRSVSIYWRGALGHKWCASGRQSRGGVRCARSLLDSISVFQTGVQLAACLTLNPGALIIAQGTYQELVAGDRSGYFRLALAA